MIGWRELATQGLRSICLGVLFGACFVCAPLARAINPHVQITQYAHTAYRLQDGTIPTPPTRIEQTADGYIWMGTSKGLMRFDGVRFTPWQPMGQEKLVNNYIWSLLPDRDGSLWIGTGRGLSHLVNGHITNYPDVPGVIENLIQDHEGTVWFTRARFDLKKSSGPLCQVKGGTIKCFGKNEGVPFPFALVLAEDSDGHLLVGSDTSLIRWKAGSSVTYAPKGLQGPQAEYGVSDAIRDTDGSTWISMYRPGPGLGLQHVVGGKWSQLIVDGLDTSALEVSGVYRDRDNALWISTLDKGLYRVYDNHVDHYSASDGLSSDSAYGIGEDVEGNLWIMTSEGLDRFHALPVVTYTQRQGLGSAEVRSVSAAPDGSLWAATSSGVDILKDGHVSHLREREGLPGKVVSSIFRDHLGHTWLSVDDNIVNYDGSFSVIKKDDGTSVGSYSSVTEDTSGAIWICIAKLTGFHLFRVKDRHVQEVQLPADMPYPYSVAANADGGIWLGLSGGVLASYKDGNFKFYPLKFPNKPVGYTGPAPVRNIVKEANGAVFATNAFGLMEKRGDVIHYLTNLNGIPERYVSTIQRDNQGDLYLFQDGDVLSIKAEEMERWWNDPTSKVAFQLYGSGEGARPGVAYSEPSSAKTADGRLWLSPEDGYLQMVDPAHLAFNSRRPPVVIEALFDGDKDFPLQNGVRLPPRLRSLHLDYTALSLVAPQNVHFRYRLEGHDTDWQDAGTRRQAFYNDLPPGHYRFHVIASNNDGVWNDEGASLSFYVAPTFYQRLWFRALLVLLALATLWLFYIYRLSLATEQVRIRLTERLAERERIARDLHDTFFQGIQGLLLRFNTATTQLPADEPARTIFVATLEQSDQVMLEGRKLVLDLRDTGEDDELEDLLAQAGEDLRSLHPAQFELTMIGERRVLQSATHSELYSLVREALYNAFRHANATLIEIEVHYTAESLNIRVRDNGRGMDQDVLRDGRRAGHWGLPGMYERAAKLGGTLTLWSRPGTGTELELSVPGANAYKEEAKSVLPEWVIRWFRERRSVAGQGGS